MSKPQIQLRDYQIRSTDEIRAGWAKGLKCIVLCLPTGAGKTYTFSFMALSCLRKDIFHKVLILTNRIELLTQAGGALARLGIKFEAITADNKRINLQARCFVAMVDTYFNRLKKHPELANMTLVIIDEAHVGSFKKVFAKWQELGASPFVIGATATPISASKKTPMSLFYEEIVCPVQISQLIREGALVPAVTVSAKIDRSLLKNDSKSNDYTDESQMKAFDKRQVYEGLIDKFRRFCLRPDGTAKKTIVFNVNVAHSIRVTQEFIDAGFVARHVDGETDQDERESILLGFKSGAFPIVCNPNILTAGFDDPSVEVIIVNRATKSLTMWLQACGRGSRPAPGKDHFTILDMAANWQELGLWENDRDWHAIFHQKPKTSREGIVPQKECGNEECGCVVHASARVCSFCGYEFPIKPKEVVQDVEFVRVNTNEDLLRLDKQGQHADLSAKDFERLRELKERKKGWVIWRLRDICKTEEEFYERLGAMAKEWGFSKSWVKKVDYQPAQAVSA